MTTSIISDFKKALLTMAFAIPMLLSTAQQTPNYVLILIDIQDFYFPGGGAELSEPEAASLQAAALLKKFRDSKLPVIHIRHNAKTNAGIHKNVLPAEGESVITKDHANGFVDTDLKKILDEIKADSIVICGMQTHMCVEATTRAAADYGYRCIVVHDACATRDLAFQGIIVPARQVHISTLATLNRTYARITATDDFISGLK